MTSGPGEHGTSIGRRGAVGVVISEGRFLAIRRSENVVAPSALCFPGGGIAAGETDEQAVVREFHEELGAAIVPVRCVWRSTTRWHVELAWWLGRLEVGAQLAANPAEVASIHWLTADEMLADVKLLASNRGFFWALAAGEITLD